MPAITKPNQYFDATLYTGTNSSLSVTNGGSFQPDFVWTKVRSTTGQNVLNDSIRGVDKTLYSALTNAEQTNTAGTGITAFNSNGYTLGTQISGTGDTNYNGSTYVGWQWKAGGAAVTNTAGSITSQVSANPTAGFSIVTWTGTGSTATIGHGLGVAPKMIIWMHRTNAGAYNHITYHASLPSAAYVVYLNLSNAQSSDNNAFNSTAPTSSVFTVGGYNSSDTMVAYCFAEVAGYSAFGSYTGNGSTDGSFVYLGFKPRFVMIKRSNTTGDWIIYDSARSTYNGITSEIYPNLNNAEDNSSVDLDFVSNGIKLRNSGSGVNASGDTYIYMAFAEAPLKYATAR